MASSNSAPQTYREVCNMQYTDHIKDMDKCTLQALCMRFKLQVSRILVRQCLGHNRIRITNLDVLECLRNGFSDLICLA